MEPSSRDQQSDKLSATDRSAFEQAGQEERISIVTEFLYFLRDNKKWWLLPILLVLGMVSLLVALGSSGAAPFIYTFF